MSEVLKAAVTAVQLIVAGVGGSGPKSTAVNFTKDAAGVASWAWFTNSQAASIRAGSVITAESVRYASVKTTYIDKTGAEIELKVPKRQCWLGGSVVIDAPTQEPLPEMVVVVTDAAIVYADRVDAKAVVAAGDEPF